MPAQHFHFLVAEFGLRSRLTLGIERLSSSGPPQLEPSVDRPPTHSQYSRNFGPRFPFGEQFGGFHPALLLPIPTPLDCFL